MKKLLLVLLMTAVGAIIFADGPVEIKGYENTDYTIYKNEAAMIFDSVGDRTIGEFTLGEMKEFAFDLSIPFQKMQYVRNSKLASAVIPGMGQYMNNDALSGTLFLLSDLAVIAGTLIGAYYLLPDELKFDALDYDNESAAAIQAKWENQSCNDLLPSVGVMAAGFVLSGIVRLISADHAGKLAQENIANGSIKFEPKLILPSFDSNREQSNSQGGFGLGMSIGL